MLAYFYPIKLNSILRIITIIYLIFWTYLVLLISKNNWCVAFNDFFGFSNSNLVSFYKNSFWPSGYPLLLKTSELFTDDKLLAGRSISLISTFIILVYFYKRFRHNYEIFSLTTIIIFLSSNFYIFANYECSDVTGTMFFCLGLLNTYLFINTNKALNLVFGATLYGFSCCFRHQYLIPGIIALLVTVVIHFKYLNKKDFINCLLFFLIGISPHAIPSLIHNGTIFSTSHASNLLFATLPKNHQTFGIGMMDIMKQNISSFELFTDFGFVKAFFRNYIGNIIDFITQTIPGHVISYFAFGGVIFLFTNRKYKLLKFLFFLYLSFVMTVSVFKFDIRYYLPLIPVSCLLSSYFIFSVYNSFKSKIQQYIFIFISLCILISPPFWSIYRGLLHNPKLPWLQTPIEVQNQLQSIGYEKADQVLSFSHHFHDTHSQSKQRYRIPWLKPNFSGFNSTLEILNFCEKEDIKFIVYHDIPSTISEVRGLNRQILLELEDNASLKLSTSHYTILKI